MLEAHVKMVAAQLGVPRQRVEAAGALLAEGATIPFIARYRKEMTGGVEYPQRDDQHRYQF